MAAGGANAVAMARRPVSRRGRRGMVDKSIVRVSGDAVRGVGTCGKEEWKKRVSESFTSTRKLLTIPPSLQPLPTANSHIHVVLASNPVQII